MPKMKTRKDLLFVYYGGENFTIRKFLVGLSRHKTKYTIEKVITSVEKTYILNQI